MQSLQKNPITRNIFRTTVYLGFMSGLTFFAVAMIFYLLGLSGTNRFVFLFLIMGVGAFVGGTLWAKSIIQTHKSNNVWRAAILCGLVFGISVFLVSHVLETIEQDLFHRGLLNSPGIHAQFIGLFSLAIFVTSALTSTVMAVQTIGRRQALLYGFATAIICVALFIVIDLLMYAVGWRVGHPDFPERATMQTVLAAGLGISLLAGGTSIGILIERSAPKKNHLM